MMNAIKGSHQRMFYRTADLEISALENTSSGAFLPDLKNPIEESQQGWFL